MLSHTDKDILKLIPTYSEPALDMADRRETQPQHGNGKNAKKREVREAFEAEDAAALDRTHE